MYEPARRLALALSLAVATGLSAVVGLPSSAAAQPAGASEEKYAAIVVDAATTVRLIAVKPAAVVADGTEIGELEPGQSVLVSQSASPVKVVYSGAFELGVRLRQSLREGHA